jgi:hypothetical protein
VQDPRLLIAIGSARHDMGLVPALTHGAQVTVPVVEQNLSRTRRAPESRTEVVLSMIRSFGTLPPASAAAVANTSSSEPRPVTRPGRMVPPFRQDGRKGISPWRLSREACRATFCTLPGVYATRAHTKWMIPVAFACACVDRASLSAESCVYGCAKAVDGAYGSRTRAAHWQPLRSARRIPFLPHGKAHESYSVAESATTRTTTGTPWTPWMHGTKRRSSVPCARASRLVPA